MKILNKSFAGHTLTVIMLLASPFVVAKASAAQLAITTAQTLPSGAVGAPYSTTLAASGGVAPYIWTVAAGTLPTGLSLAPTGAITGKPTVPGMFSILATVIDSKAAFQSAPFDITIGGAITPLTISTAALPAGMVGTAYSQTLVATGGVAPYAWTLDAGSTLPKEFTLAKSGVISGMPATPGTFTLLAHVADSLLSTASKTISLTINPIGPTRAGVLSQIASGGGWKTSIYLVNTSSSSVPVVVKFWSDAGGVLSLPFTMTENGAVQVGTASSVTATVAPNDTMLVVSDSGASVESTGWVEVISTGHITGYGAFHYVSPKGMESEGTLPLESAFESSLIIPYDGVGLNTAVALTNLTPASAVKLTATVWGNGGKQLSSQPILLPAGGHTAFVLSTLFPDTLDNRGFVEFTAPSGSTFTGLGLRIDPTGGLTSIPVLERP